MIITRRVFAAISVSAAAGLLAPRARSADAITGQWTLVHSYQPDKVHLTLIRSRDGHEDTSTNSSDWATGDLKGLDLSQPTKHDVHFTVARDAGRLDAEGFAAAGQGAGLFTFTPAPAFSRQMADAGFAGVTEEQQFSCAIHDVSVAFAKEMKGAGLTELDVGKLLAFRIHRVDRAYVDAFHAAGARTTSAEKLISFRIHGVSPDYVQALSKLGLAADDNQLIAMRIHNVTPEYVAGLKSHGLDKLTPEQVLKLRIHGIS